MGYHTPVMVKEVVDNLVTDKSGVYVDLTFGSGGHSMAILSRLVDGHLYAFDQDIDVERNLEDFNNFDNFTFILSNFKYLKRFMNYYGIDNVDGIFADFGVSSHQIDTPQRGFSTRFCGELDMRMNKNSTVSAKTIVNEYSIKDLHRILAEYGELHNAASIAKIIIEQRKTRKIETTDALKTLILSKSIIPKKYQQKFLSQVFQALRMEVNNELVVIEDMLSQALSLLKVGGRLVTVSYHSLEDRLVKNFLRNSFSQHSPDANGLRQLTKKTIMPSSEEIIKNPRSRSAKLRVGIKY